MYISDTLLQKIAERFQLNQQDTDNFIELIRDMQAEVTLKSFFIWYGQFKKPLQNKVLERIGKELNDESTRKTAERRLFELMTTEITHNASVRKFMIEKSAEFTGEILQTIGVSTGKEGMEIIMKEILKHNQAIALAYNSGELPISEEEKLEQSAKIT